MQPKSTIPTEWRADNARYLNTDEAAAILRVKPHTLRSALCRAGHYFGVVPVKSRNRFLLWPADPIEAVARGEVTK